MTVIPEMVEGTIDQIVAQLQKKLNDDLDLVAELWASRGSALNLPHVAPNHIYVSEAIQGLVLPAVFVVADDSPHDLKAQQWLKQDHQVLVGIVVESTQGAQLIQRIAWRYAQAAWLALHDQNLDTTRVLVTRISYGPTLFARDEQRTFRKDITMRLAATQREAFEH